MADGWYDAVAKPERCTQVVQVVTEGLLDAVEKARGVMDGHSWVAEAAATPALQVGCSSCWCYVTLLQ